MITARLAPESLAQIRKDCSVAARAQEIGEMVLRQIDDRFETQGASGGETWPEKTLPAGGNPPLHGFTSQLRQSFAMRLQTSSRSRVVKIVIESDLPYASTHELGTVGKGGILPTIVPTKAKALFVALSERAQAADPVSVGLDGTEYRRDDLRKGRISKDHRLQVQVDGKWVDGTPDYIFMSKVDIPPRPMLPTSPGEQDALTNFILEGP